MANKPSLDLVTANITTLPDPRPAHPVPASIRTDRKKPRILAITLVVLWLVIFALGTLTLSSYEAERVMGSDDQIN